MKNLLIIASMALTACAGSLHIGGGSECVKSVTSDRTLPQIIATLQGMGVEKGLANKTAQALMTSRLTPSQVCSSLSR